ncbi:MAG TPA: S8 family serine peptidase [Pyrinomonadaceae bacterium]|jgi:hypothetical protein
MRLPIPSPRELVVVARPEAAWRLTHEGVTSLTGFDLAPLNELLRAPEVSLLPLYGLSEERLRWRAETYTAATGVVLPDLSPYYRLYAPDALLDLLAQMLRRLPSVESAYVKPGAELPIWFSDIKPPAAPSPPGRPDHTALQEYLDDAPQGIGARSAWKLPGGQGDGVRIVDVEYDWRFSHEDLKQDPGGVVGGTPANDIFLRNHGTAVLGMLGGDLNTFGVTGICPRADVLTVSAFEGPPGWGSGAALRRAAEVLQPGDIILVELEYPGPRSNFQTQLDQFGYIPAEWWPDNLNAILSATRRGIIVVEAGGNGGVDLGESQGYDTPSSPPGPFPSGWHNPFRRDPIDSGAIIVGAGAASPFTPPDLSRLDFSNFDASNKVSIFDAQGWGNRVVTCGFGDLSGGDTTDEDIWYTGRFSGTSSAAPMVAGALACLQGILKARGQAPLSPLEARRLLRTTGSPQLDDPGSPASNRIGNRPDLRQLIAALPPPP